MWWSSGLACPLKISSPWGLANLAAPAQGVGPGQSLGHFICLLGPEASRELYSAHRGSCSHSALTPGPEAVTALHEGRCQMQNPEKIKVRSLLKTT